ncbi:Uma2 family endonuclease [Cyanothece sp. BG0011]|uniref:Uma2 family endonuclease n=1 Tax=Cyanothece sp. BG0011 TaxID=2082950 RepID=UPI000D1DB8DF|nr:Uma2 family endonuclease [Cyanothece sp. BG0011]
MLESVSRANQSNITYPERDGNPMSDNTKQFRWIVVIKENLELLFADNPNIFVAGDLLWYPIEGDNKTRQAPDVMIVFGRPKGDRGSYRQWVEDNITPQVVFEILSPGNRLLEMAKKFKFYEHHGVEEYYIYDPDKIDLQGWLRNNGELTVIEEMTGWVSPRLGIKFELTSENLEIFRPDGGKFLTFVELGKLRETETKRANELQQQLQKEQEQKKRLEDKLRELGIDINDV